MLAGRYTPTLATNQELYSYPALNSQGSLREVRVRKIRTNYRFAVLHRIPQFAPRIQSTLQRADSAYPLFS